MWEPFFGRGSEIILTSSVSRVLPVPDAALGAGAYLLDAVTGVIGGRARWRTLPWVVILFGLAVGPLGAISVLLVVLQPLLFGTWCTLCLASAVVSLAMIGPAMDEVLASLQSIRGTRPHERPARIGARWARAVVLATGVAVAAAPTAIGYDGGSAVAHQVLGALAASVALVSLSSVTRELRRLEVVVAAGLLATAALAQEPGVRALGLAAGVLLLALQVPAERRRDSLGGGWRALFPTAVRSA